MITDLDRAIAARDYQKAAHIVTLAALTAIHQESACQPQARPRQRQQSRVSVAVKRATPTP